MCRPKLPQKLRTGKQWNEETGSQISVGSSLSATSLNEIDELDESDDASRPTTLRIDSPVHSRTPSPEAKVMNRRVYINIPAPKFNS